MIPPITAKKGTIAIYHNGEWEYFCPEQSFMSVNYNKWKPSMKLLIKDRQQGKTTGLIYTSEATGYPIVTTHGQAEVNRIIQEAENLGCIIPKPITISELRSHRVRGNRMYEKVLVDDVQEILEAALCEYLHCDVKCATLTNELR